MQTQYPLAVITTGIEGGLLAILSQVDLGFTTGQLQRMIDDRTWKRPHELEASVRRWTGNPCHVLSFLESETREPGARRVLNDVVEEGVTFAGPPSWLRRGLHTLRDDR